MFEVLNISVIIPAAGKGERFNAGDAKLSKLEADLSGRPVLVRAVELFTKRPDVKQIIVAVAPDNVDQFKLRWGDKLGFLGVTIVPGGKRERWETVMRAIESVDDEATHIAVHDAARPLSPPDLVDRVFEAAKKLDAVIPAVPVSATIKRAEGDTAQVGEGSDPLDAILGAAGKVEIEAHRVLETVPRADLWLVQTPQVFERGLLAEAYRQVAEGKLDAGAITDDAGLIEAMGGDVHIVEGDQMNVKITRPADLDFAATLLAGRTLKTRGDDLGPKRQFPTWAEMDDE